MMIIVDPSWLPSVGAHWTRRDVRRQAKPDEIFHTILLHNGHHRLTEGRHGLKPLFPATALVEGLNRRNRLGRLRLPNRAHSQAPLAPALNLALYLLAQRHGILVPLSDHLWLTLGGLPHDRAEGGALLLTASRAASNSPSSRWTCGSGHKEKSPAAAIRARVARAASLQSPTYNSPWRPKLACTRAMQGLYSGSSARSPDTTSVARGIPKGSRTACITLT
jgi:hypothetical protein